MKVASYIRISTVEQTTALQVDELQRYIAARGWESVGTYEDTMSGAKSARPGLCRLMTDARLRKFDVVICWKLDRFGRSLVDCLNNIRDLDSAGVRFIAITQNIDTDQQNPASRFALHILAAAAEFERSLIKERVKSGMQAARRRGTVLGRPKAVFDRARVRQLRSEGMSIAKIGRELNIGVGTVARVLEGATA
jgi:DNA invertase Pin-like site-specific DNA recombinase